MLCPYLKAWSNLARSPLARARVGVAAATRLLVIGFHCLPVWAVAPLHLQLPVVATRHLVNAAHGGRAFQQQVPAAALPSGGHGGGSGTLEQ